MRNENKFNNILNECLDRIFKGETVERCLRDYPEQAKELELLLKTALSARSAAGVQPRPEFKTEARRQFQAALVEMKVKHNEGKARAGYRWQWRWHSAWAISLTAVVIIVLGSVSTVAAAGGSMPGSKLYPVKLAAEQVQLALTPGKIAKAELNAKFADRRTEELVYAASKGNAQEVQIVASRLNVNLSNITELAASNSRSKSESVASSTNAKVNQNASPPEKAPQPLMGAAPPAPAVPVVPAAPPEAKPVPPPAPAAPGRARLPAEPGAPAAAALAAPFSENNSAQDNKGLQAEKTVEAHSAKYDTLKKIVDENFEKRIQKLEETLKNAAPEVRPAIKQAIAQSEVEYQRTLQNLEETDKQEHSSQANDSKNTDDSKNPKEPTKTPGRKTKEN